MSENTGRIQEDLRKDNRKMQIKKIWIALCVFISVMAGTGAVAQAGEVMNAEVENNQIVLYVQNPGEVQSVECQIGTTQCTEIAYGMIEEQQTPVHTLILWDNSLSVREKYRPMIKEIMTNLAANRMPQEQITIATFSDQITYVAEKSGDFAQLKQVIDSVQYADQETYLTDVLYELLTDWNQKAEPGYKRIVIVSDGVDNKSLGYTKEELYELLEEHPYPIYTIGCTYENTDNSEALKNMFALSRMTHADSWTIDEIQDTMEVANSVAKGNQVMRIAVTPPNAICDGTAKGVKLTVTAADGTAQEFSTVVNMPFGAVETEPETKETETALPVPETVPSTQEQPEESQKQPIMDIRILVLLAVVVAVLAVVFVIVIIKITGKKKDSFESAPPEAHHEDAVDNNSGEREATEFVGEPEGDGQTAVFWANSAPTQRLILTDLTHPGRSFDIPISSGIVVVGRGSQDGCQVLIDYDKSVSHRHCQIHVENGQMKIQDLGSKNKTYVDDREVIQETVLNSGSIIKLGKVKLKVELRG